MSSYEALMTVLAALGLAWCLRGLWLLGRGLLSGLNGFRWKQWAKDGSYALITGATDGIGKEFAVQLATKYRMNLILVSRTPEKLKAVRQEILDKTNQSVSIETLAVDFTKVTEKDYDKIQELSNKYPVSVLVNNVATNHHIPTPFVEEDPQVLQDIVNVNIGVTVRLTRLLLPQMVSRKCGLVLNIGSFAGMIPTAFLQTYSGSKAFLRAWSEALAMEVRKDNVHVEHVNTYFVVSNMSKISRPSSLIPTAAKYVASVVKRVGGSPMSTPYPSHHLMSWVFESLVPHEFLVKKTYDMQVSIRKRALRKQERLRKVE